MPQHISSLYRLFSAICTALVLSVASLALADDVLMAHDKGFWKDGFDAMAEAGNFEHTSQTTDQYKAFIQSSMVANNAPAIFTWWTGKALENIVETGQVAAVDALWDEKIAAGEFAPGARELFQVDGKTYAIPLLLARWVVFYNKTMFEEHSLSAPETWEELVQVAETLKAAGITPFNATVQDGWRGFVWFEELMIRSNPEAYLGLHTGDVAYDSPEVQAVFDLWSHWYSKGWFTDPRSNEEAQDFARGNAAMYLMGEWAVGALTDSGMTIGEDLGVFIMPNMSAALAPQVIVEGSPILISKDAFNDEQAHSVYVFWASEEAANLWADVQSLYNGNLKAKAPNAIIQEVSDLISEQGHVARTRWWEAVPADLQGDLVAELSSFMLTPTAEKAEEVMANMQALNAEYWADQ